MAVSPKAVGTVAVAAMGRLFGGPLASWFPVGHLHFLSCRLLIGSMKLLGRVRQRLVRACQNTGMDSAGKLSCQLTTIVLTCCLDCLNIPQVALPSHPPRLLPGDSHDTDTQQRI